MAKYRKKPVIIEAIQWNGHNINDIKMFVGSSLNVITHKHYDPSSEPGSTSMVSWEDYTIFIHTLEGDMKCDKGDYIIRGVNGEFYPCKPDIFDKTYEVIDEQSTET